MESNQQLHDSQKNETEIPVPFKVYITVIASIISIFIILLYVYLIFYNPNYLDPQKFGLSPLLIFFLTLLIFVNFPFERMGLRIKKIGMIELEAKVVGQAKDVSKEIADLQVKIDELAKGFSSNEKANIEDEDLRQLIIDLLKEYKRYAFSPSRIKNFGKWNKNYSVFDNYSLEEIKVELRRLLANDIVSTRIGDKGNTLYTYNKYYRAAGV